MDLFSIYDGTAWLKLNRPDQTVPNPAAVGETGEEMHRFGTLGMDEGSST
ncbi:hypothetical protein [Hymenobacter sp.]|nr:hypothetical protein [Hymenobacter sp.]